MTSWALDTLSAPEPLPRAVCTRPEDTSGLTVRSSHRPPRHSATVHHPRASMGSAEDWEAHCAAKMMKARGTSPRGGTSTFVASSFLRSVSATERLLVYLSVLNQIQGKQDYQIVWCKCNFTKSYGCSVPETKCWEFGLRCLSRVWALIFTSLSAAR